MEKCNIHIDDFALSISSSKDIIDCINTGKISGISVISNMSCFEECIKLLKNNIDLSIHLNFVEGKSVTDNLKYLTDCNGYFKLSWVKLFFLSFNIFKYRKVKNELKIEIDNQIKKLLPYQKKIIIDSHQHTHMIPIVFNAFLDVIKEKKYNIKYVRVSNERLVPFIKNYFKMGPYNIVNIIKCMVLKILSINVISKLNKNSIKYKKVYGILFSGNMNIKVFDIIKNYNNGEDYIFHVGKLLKKEINNEYKFIKFHTSNNRKIEKEVIMN